MGKTREIRQRQGSVGNIRRITRTMEMIASAKSRQTMNRAAGARPYTNTLTEVLAAVLGTQQAGEVSHPLLRANEASLPRVTLAITSNRGLCGGYNGGVVRLTERVVEEAQEKNETLELRVSGKRGIGALRARGTTLSERYTQFDDKVRFREVAGIADELMGRYRRGEISAVEVVYTRFVSAGEQRPEVLELLPVPRVREKPELKRRSEVTYEFRPEAGSLIGAMAPRVVRMRLFQCFLDAAVSEQMARRRAMKSATDNANQMIDNLRRQANRARQTEITSELLDILGGVEALKQ